MDKEMVIKHFAVPENFKIEKAGTHVYSFGWFYGKKPRKRAHKSILNQIELKSDFQSKLEAFFDEFKFERIQSITEDSIKIVQVNPTTTRADVFCVFCEKKTQHSVQLDKNGSWNFSNFRKHVKLRHVAKMKKESDTSSISNSITKVKTENGTKHALNNSPNSHSTPKKVEHENAAKLSDASDIMEMPIILEDFGIHFEDPDPSQKPTADVLYAQFSEQNLRLVEATLKNNETQKFMVVNMNNRYMNVKVNKIVGDGNCLFATAVHQIEFVKIGSTEHAKKTALLRQQVVKHIRENFQWYKQVLKGQVDCDDASIDELGKQYLEKLSGDGFWAGSEALSAIANMHKVNILSFCEKGTYSFTTRFNPNFDRTIFLAYRGYEDEASHQMVYNHYDSICGIEEDLLFNCAMEMGGKMEAVIKTEPTKKINI